jgi:hypothetical protein
LVGTVPGGVLKDAACVMRARFGAWRAALANESVPLRAVAWRVRLMNQHATGQVTVAARRCGALGARFNSIRCSQLLGDIFKRVAPDLGECGVVPMDLEQVLHLGL